MEPQDWYMAQPKMAPALGQALDDWHWNTISTNMFRSCYRMHTPDPQTATYGAICTQILVTKQEIQHLSKDAPAL